MTNSEQICGELGKLYFYKELVKSNLIYTIKDEKYKQERELADTILRVGDYIFTIQIKEMEDTNKDILEWLDSKVYKKAKNQMKKTYEEIFKNIKFKDPENADIIENIERCTIIPIIIFDIKEKRVNYEKTYKTKDGKLLIHILDLKDFKTLCGNLISPMEMVRYLNERKEYLKNPIIKIVIDDQIIIAKRESEESMLELYRKKYELDKIQIDQLIKFNTYLTLLEKHCIKNNEDYRIMIKIMSQFNAGKIEGFIERLDLIIEKAFKNEWYYNSYIIDEQQSILFVSAPKEEVNIEYIDFISNLFMHKFKIKKVLTIISYAIKNGDYELDFALITYDENNKKLLEEALNSDFSKLWNTKLIKKC